MADPLFMYKLRNGLFGTPETYGGLLGDDQARNAQNAGMMNMGASLLAAGGPSPTPTNFGQVLGGALMQGRQAQQQAGQQQLQALLLKQQIQAAKSKDGRPSEVQTYEFFDKLRRENPEAYQAWLSTQNKQNVPSSLLEVQAVEKNPYLIKQLERIAAAKIGAPYTPTEVGGAKGGFDRRSSSFNQMSTPQQEVGFVADKARAESEAKGKGTATAEIWAGIQKKGAASDVVMGTLDIADPLIDVATGSTAGSAVDTVARFFGQAMDGDKAIASLKVLQAGLMLNMPRMEGPQSDRDALLYKEAAASLGDPGIPRELKKAAVKTIRDLQAKYKQAATAAPDAAPQNRPPLASFGKQ